MTALIQSTFTRVLFCRVRSASTGQLFSQQEPPTETSKAT
jgi:hypothetical protein